MHVYGRPDWGRSVRACVKAVGWPNVVGCTAPTMPEVISFLILFVIHMADDRMNLVGSRNTLIEVNVEAG
jgi:hypothetical protein